MGVVTKKLWQFHEFQILTVSKTMKRKRGMTQKFNNLKNKIKLDSSKSFTSRFLIALSHSFCPGTLLVQAFSRLLILSVSNLADWVRLFLRCGVVGSATHSLLKLSNLFDAVWQFFSWIITSDCSSASWRNIGQDRFQTNSTYQITKLSI